MNDYVLRGVFVRHVDRWLIRTRSDQMSTNAEFVVAVSPRTGREGVVKLVGKVPNALSVPLWSWRATCVVRNRGALAEDPETAESRWQAHLAEVKAAAPVEVIGAPTRKPRRSRKPQEERHETHA
jgi:hypothetical protein